MRRRLVRFVHRHIIAWYLITLALYAAMIPLTILVFPATNLLLTVVVLFGGLTSSVAALASVLSDAEDE